ncbi:heparan-alpha-glucosaminide N-acetyltransferase domain-containing protein, partial [Georgenia thermotolerans]
APPAASAAGAAAGPPPPPAPRARLVGVDLARGLAILGMFVAHLGADRPDGTHDPAWFVLADGRSAALFALLAGVSLALSSGRDRLPAGLVLLHARMTILVRAGLLLLLGWVLVGLGTPVAVILPAYAVLFLLALPFLAVRRRWLLLAAGVAAVVSPTLVALVAVPNGGPSLAARLSGTADPVHLPGDELVTGYYPALVYLAYVLLGLAVGRTDLTRTRTQAGLVGVGAGLAVLGWGLSRLALDAVGPDASPLTRHLLSGAAHEDTTLEVVGNCGTALAVIGLFLLLTRPTPAGRAAGAALSPLAAAGSMSLTVYTAQIVAIFVLGEQVVWAPTSNAVLVWFVVLALAGAWLWRRLVGRGPLEQGLGAAARAVAGPRP